MPVITLPDGNQKSFADAVSVFAIAKSISSGLAKNAIAGKIDDQLVDLSHLVQGDVNLQIITVSDEEALDIIRHSTAHLLAHAVKHLFPKAQVTIGPVIENGFYYDFAFERPFTTADLAKIEKEMKKLAKQNIVLQREIMERDDAIQLFREMGEEYKAQIIADIPTKEAISLYRQGDFIDLCRGPHVSSTGKLKAFKLTKVSGAYWRGDSNNEMLQRIYGTAWANQQDLDDYLHRLEEAEKRDHRKLGKQLHLFHVQEEAPGMIFWHKRGWQIYLLIENYIREQLKQYGYQEIKTPQMIDRKLWEKSGHWDKFHDDMFVTSSENREYAIKPMNCPAHIQVYNQSLKSYRDLPIRFAEFGSCHRNEASGTLHGIMRLRHFVQDDAHIFCAEEQVQDEVSQFIDLLFNVYRDFGFNDILIKLSTRPEQRVGSDDVWDRSEKSLQLALDNKKLDWELQPGEGAFYGPKIEFSLRDCLGRIWQCGTMQVDFSMPERLGANYVDADGIRKTPVMLHRAILGSLERFIGVLIEHYAGLLPLWLAPVQLAILTIADRHIEYAEKIQKQLVDNQFRVDLDLRNEKIGFKIRENTLLKIPYLLIIGDKELETGTITMRKCNGENMGVFDSNGLVKLLFENLKT